jgi:hypothetical protein
MTIGRAALAVAVLALLAVLLVPYDNPSGDATGYGVTLRDGGPLRLNPNHLLLKPSSYATHVVVSRVLDVEPLTTLLWASRLNFVAYALVTFAIGAMLFPGAWLLPFTIAAGCVASYAILVFGTDGEPILFAHLPLLLGGALHLLAWRRGSTAWHTAAGLGYGLSILVYVSNVIPLGVIGLVSVVAAARRRNGTALVAPVVGGAVVALGVIVAHGASGSPLPLHRWMLAYGGGGSNLSYGGSPLLGLFRVVFGFGGSLVGARGAARLVRTWTEGEESIRPEAGDVIDLVVWAAALAAAVVATWLAVRQIRHGSDLRRIVLVVCLASSALLAVFNFLWIGSDPQFWVPVLPLLWIAWAFGLEPSRRRVMLVASLCVLVLLPWNVFRSLRPLRGDPEPKLRRAELMTLADEPGLIVVPGLDWVDSYGRYHGLGDRAVLSFWRLSIDPVYADSPDDYAAAIESTIEAALGAGRPVYVRGVLDEPFPEGVPWREMEPRGFRLDRIQELLARYPASPAFTIRGQDWWELTAAVDSATP